MAKAAFSKVFVVGRKRIHKVKRDIISEPITGESTVAKVAEVKRGKKREARFQAALQKGDIIMSGMSVDELKDKRKFPNLVASFDNCMNEAELRNEFPKNGIGHNFFMGGHKFKFYVTSDQVNLVAQVHKDNSPIYIILSSPDTNGINSINESLLLLCLAR